MLIAEKSVYYVDGGLLSCFWAHEEFFTFYMFIVSGYVGFAPLMIAGFRIVRRFLLELGCMAYLCFLVLDTGNNKWVLLLCGNLSTLWVLHSAGGCLARKAEC